MVFKVGDIVTLSEFGRTIAEMYKDSLALAAVTGRVFMCHDRSRSRDAIGVIWHMANGNSFTSSMYYMADELELSALNLARDECNFK